MKHIPNIITISRMILSVLLFFTMKETWIFITIFLLCGLSDILDGYIARRLKLTSPFGAKLDSLADLELFGIVMICFIILVGRDIKMFYPYLSVIIIIRLLNLLIAFIRNHSFLSLHTWGNKLTGILVYISICLFIITKWKGILYGVTIVAILSAVEELLIHITIVKPDPNRRGLFWK